MSDIDALKALVRRAYDDGFRKGNGMDSGCRPDDHGDFDEFWREVDGGDLASALAALLDTAEAPMPHLVPGGLVPFKEGDFVLVGMQRDHNRTSVELRDRESWERDNRYDPAWDQGGPRESTFSTGVPTGHAPPPGGSAMLPTPEPLQCTVMHCTLQGGHQGEHRSLYVHPNTGKVMCHCDGPPHVYSPGWCPAEGPKR